MTRELFLLLVALAMWPIAVLAAVIALKVEKAGETEFAAALAALAVVAGAIGLFGCLVAAIEFANTLPSGKHEVTK